MSIHKLDMLHENVFKEYKRQKNTMINISIFFRTGPSILPLHAHDLSQGDLPSPYNSIACSIGVSLLLSKGNLVHFFDLLAEVVEHKHLAGRGGFVDVDLEGGKAGGGTRRDAEKDNGHENVW